MSTTKEERTILAFKLQAQEHKPELGYIRPIAEITDDHKLIELTPSNFCYTNRVFITNNYQTIDEKFKERQIFRINVNVSSFENRSTVVDPYKECKYVAQGAKAERLKSNELIEIIDGELPDRNYRFFENSSYPSTDYIFIRNKSGDCFGPFSRELKDNDLGFFLGLLDDKPLLKSYKLALGQLFKINNNSVNKNIINCSIENRAYHFILNINEFINDSEKEYYDYASDEEIVKHCAKLASDMGTTTLNKANWDSFRKIASINAKFNQGLNKTRLEQLSTLTADISDIQYDIQENIGQFLKSDNGHKLINDFIDKKRPQLLEPLRKELIDGKDKEIEEKEDKLSSIDNKLREKEKELKGLSAEVERKRKEANQDVILENAVAERDEQIRDLDKSILEKEKNLNELIKNHNSLERLDDIKNEIQVQENIYDRQRKKNDGIESITQELQNEYNTAEDKLRTKLTGLKPYVEAINGSFISDNKEERAVFVNVNTLIQADSFEQQRLVVETVKHNLRLKGRYFESWQIANFLISTQQSFITFLAGLPGVGKTSLARLLAESQNLQPRLQEVSVARGWTSQKDLIGFYNPLSNRFQPSNTGLYAFIKALSKDDQAMAYILLDEANLSPIEHYWSAFMAMADSDGERILRLGQDTITVPTVLRFLATINYDGTTEPLSPRVVDRAPVLIMEPSDTLLEDSDDMAENEIALPLSAIEMNKLFGLAQKTPSFQDDEAVIFNKVRKILSDSSLEKGRPLSISQRKEIVIRQYCAQASSLMRSFGCDDFKALDLAILQHVLPQVRGNGQKFAERLKELKQTCENEGLKDSAAYLERMLSYGETELHSYDFFCW